LLSFFKGDSILRQNIPFNIGFFFTILGGIIGFFFSILGDTKMFTSSSLQHKTYKYWWGRRLIAKMPRRYVRQIVEAVTSRPSYVVLLPGYSLTLQARKCSRAVSYRYYITYR
jgi:hypothetical protein